MNTDRKRFFKFLSAFICVYLWFQISFLAFSLAAVEGFADEGDSKLTISFKAIPAKDRDMIQKIINEENVFLKWRDEEIETNTTTFNYLLDRPVLTSTILTELGIGNYQILPPLHPPLNKGGTERGYFQYDDGHGFTGGLKIVYKKDREKIYQGNYIYTVGVGVPVRLSGEWVLVLKYKEKNELLEIDIDFYLTQENEGVGRIAKDLPFILKSIMAEKVNSYIESVREISEMIHSDPEDVYDRLKESGEIKDRDLREFKKIILSNN
ncbi:MAG: hypothetical protein HY096_11720 [Nitrospinae bacterium]|nr:hypothetical protein [Nitrospinota bacterium]